MAQWKKAKKADMEPATVEVVLKKSHSHQGKECCQGDRITVKARQVEFLRAQGVI